MDIKPRRKRCEKGILRRKTERRKCYPQEIPEDKILLTFCPQTYHLLWIKIFSISAHLPTLSKKPITGVGVKSNGNCIGCCIPGIDHLIDRYTVLVLLRNIVPADPYTVTFGQSIIICYIQGKG